MKFKEITLSDIDIISNIYTETFSSEPWNEPWTKEISNKRLKQMINCEGFFGLIAYEEDSPVGMILGNEEYSFRGLEFYIKEFCTSNTVRGKGVGTFILNEFQERLKSRGVSEVWLLTSKEETTEGFYNRRGYTSCNDWVLMRKKL